MASRKKFRPRSKGSTKHALFGVRFPATLALALTKHAKRLGTTRNHLLRQMVEHCLKEMGEA